MAKPRTLQVITDISDISYNEMFAIMHGIAENLTRAHIDFAPVTAVEEFSIIQGAFLTRLMAKSYVCPVVMLTNVSPHQTYKSDLIGKIKDKDVIFMGSNNGIFDWLAKDYELEYLAEVNVRKPYVVDGELIYLPGQEAPKDYEDRFNQKTDYFTFSAHVILGAIAVGLAAGVDYRKFGEDRDKDFIVPMEIKSGEVVHIDNYGNLKMYGEFQFDHGTDVEILLNGDRIGVGKYVKDRMMSYPTNSFAVYPSTSLQNMTDLAMIRGDASKYLGIKIGDVLAFNPL